MVLVQLGFQHKHPVQYRAGHHRRHRHTRCLPRAVARRCTVWAMLSRVLPVTTDTPYILRVLTTTADTGTFTICLQAPPAPPANDLCANAIPVTTYPYTSAVISTAAATDDYTASTCDGPYKNVWWKVSGVCGTMTATTCGSSFDTEMAVFSGSCGAIHASRLQ